MRSPPAAQFLSGGDASTSIPFAGQGRRLQRLLLLAALSCVAGCAPTPPRVVVSPVETPVVAQPPAASPNPSFQGIVRSASHTEDRDWYSIDVDPSALAVGTKDVVVRRGDGSSFPARLRTLLSRLRKGVGDTPTIRASIHRFGDTAMPALEIGEVIEMTVLGKIPGLDDSPPPAGASDVVPRSR